jgi:hypothetical protein
LSVRRATGAHFASDSQGRRRLLKRNRDASAALGELCLQDGDQDFDVHLNHHHTVGKTP